MICEFYDQDGDPIWVAEGIDVVASIGEQVRVPWMARKRIDADLYVVEGTVVSVVHDLTRGAVVYTIDIPEAS